MYEIKTKDPELLILMALDTINGLEQAYMEVFNVKEPPGLIMMESEEEYKEELKNAIRTNTAIKDNARLACDLVE